VLRIQLNPACTFRKAPNHYLQVYQKTYYMNNFHLNQLDKVLKYINQNLDEDLTLQKIASIGSYSSFHFHRIFRAYTSETLNGFIVRKRIEKIASILIREKSVKVSQLSTTYGFSSNSSLTKTFKKIYGISPSEFKRKSLSRYDKIIKSKNGQEFEDIEQYICHINNLKNWIIMTANVTVKKINPIKMVYVNHIGIQDLESSFHKIIDWTLKKNLVNEKEIEIVRIYNDSFKITSPDKVGMQIGIPIQEKTESENGINYQELEPKLCVVGSFEINLQEFEKSWSSMFIWMNENGYKPTEIKPFEIIKNNYNEHPQKKCIVDMYIPIE